MPQGLTRPEKDWPNPCNPVDAHNIEPCHRVLVTIRPARLTDMDHILALGKEVFQEYGPYEDMLRRWFESGMSVTLLALMGKVPAGFAMFSRLDEWHLPRVSELLAIAVEPGRQRLGVGHRLMREVEKRAKDIGVQTLVLHTAVDNRSGQKLFRKCGFLRHEMKRGFYPAGQDALMMFKDIR